MTCALRMTRGQSTRHQSPAADGRSGRDWYSRIDATYAWTARCVSIVWLRLKLTMTTAHDHTVVADDSRIDDDDTITKVVGHHSHLATAATHSTQGDQR